MVSLSIHPTTLCSLTAATTTTAAANVSSLFPRRPISPYSLLPSSARTFSIRRRRPPSLSSTAAAAAAAEALETPRYAASADPQVADEVVEEKKPLRVVVKGQEKPRLVLRFIWMEKNIGLALDQVIPGHGTVPLSPYYWWPRKDAWEELKSNLEEKPWISQKRMIIILNQATDIINLWQQSGAANL